VKPNIKRIMVQRADNYKHHFECRQTVKSGIDENLRQQIAHASGHLTAPRLSLFGATAYSRDEEMMLIALANKIGCTDPWLINPWYASETGWETFQSAWKNLPEPVDFTPNKKKLSTVEQEGTA
jgi:hypothetical protein